MAFRTLAEAIARGKGRERPFRCPVHDDHQASASVNVAKGLWVCYACGAKGTTAGVVEQEDERFAADIEEMLGFEQRIYSERWLDQFDAGPVHPYWLGRFSEAACRHFRLGFDYDTGAPVYPIRDNAGAVLGVVRRSLLQTGPKYLYPRGVVKSSLLFNYTQERVDTVALVEGAPDVVAAWEAGCLAFGIYGALLHDDQVRLLHRASPRRVVLGLDNDDAGRRAIYGWHTKDGDPILGALRRLEIEGFDVVVPDWHGVEAKDIAEVSVATRRTLLDFAPL